MVARRNGNNTPRRHNTERKQPKYPHFVKNEEYFRRLRLPRAAQSWALVVIGRFSPRFLGLMRRQWEDGDVAYEEISLATTCLATPPCCVTSFNKATRGRVSPARVRFQPSWRCERVAAARARDGAGEPIALFHPVKNRSCLSR